MDLNEERRKTLTPREAEMALDLFLCLKEILEYYGRD